jgi:hypothetical protein
MHIHIEKPRLGIPVCLLVDDPAPCINTLYYYRLQVDRERYAHLERCIPVDFLEEFIDVCQSHGMRGKFSILPYPAGLGSILTGWEGCNRSELVRWLDLARTSLVPLFDITPEILTHTLALDLQTGRLLPEPEHDWMAGRSRAELLEYMGVALKILKDAGFAPTGITQPCYFNGSRPDYTQAVLESIRAVGGPAVTFYFIDGCFEKTPTPPPPVVLLDRQRGEAVVSILDYAEEYFWSTQRPEPGQVSPSHTAERVADQFISADGQSGRLVELAQSNDWLIFCCHWQSLYSDGSRQGLVALDKVAERLSHFYAPRLNWMTASEISRYRAASEGCLIAPLPGERESFTLDAALECPDFTLSLELAGSDRIGAVTLHGESQDQPIQSLKQEAGEGLLVPGAWRQEGARLSVCFPLRKGLQILRVSRG